MLTISRQRSITLSLLEEHITSIYGPPTIVHHHVSQDVYLEMMCLARLGLDALVFQLGPYQYYLSKEGLVKNQPPWVCAWFIFKWVISNQSKASDTNFESTCHKIIGKTFSPCTTMVGTLHKASSPSYHTMHGSYERKGNIHQRITRNTI
jgi:hypothetical protein